MEESEEIVDILLPPLFIKSGEQKTRRQAYKDGDWLATFNLWVFSGEPEPSIIYQLRSPHKNWAPDKLDVTVGGHYLAGEQLTDGLREVDEEIGKSYEPEQITYLGRKVYVGFNMDGANHNNIIEIYLVQDDSPLNSYKFKDGEVYAVCRCPVSELLKAHSDKSYSFDADAVDANGKSFKKKVDHNSFPENWDDYHYKIALVADKYFKGDKNLLY